MNEEVRLQISVFLNLHQPPHTVPYPQMPTQPSLKFLYLPYVQCLPTRPTPTQELVTGG